MNSFRTFLTRSALVAAAVLALLPGCTKRSAPVGKETTAMHQDQPPHGGTPVTLGDDEFHLELVRDPETGTLSGYVLDDEMEEFVRISAPSLVLDVQRGGQPQRLVLSPVADLATGETVGNTSLYQGQADWLKTEGHFDATLEPVSIHGSTFGPTPFHFPSGNDRK